MLYLGPSVMTLLYFSINRICEIESKLKTNHKHVCEHKKQGNISLMAQTQVLHNNVARVILGLPVCAPTRDARLSIY